MTKTVIVLFVISLVGCSTAQADRVWAEWGMATATAGYDAKNNRTLISKYYLGAVGPDSVPDALRDFIIDCSKKSALAGGLAFKATASPEIGARVLAASVAFKATFTTCVSTVGAAKFLAEHFYLSFDRKEYWESGLSLKFSAENPSAQAYEIVHNAIAQKIPDPLNRAVVLFFAVQSPPQVQIKLQLPEGAKNFLRVAPMPREMSIYAQEANAKAVNRGLSIIPAVLNEPKNLPHRLGEDALETSKEQVLAQVKIGQQATQQMIDLANGGIEGVNHLSGQLKVEAGPITLHPIPPLPPLPTSVQDVGKTAEGAGKTAACVATFGLVCN